MSNFIRNGGVRFFRGTLNIKDDDSPAEDAEAICDLMDTMSPFKDQGECFMYFLR